ncbi:MAG: flagellar hook-length control protein FliK [Anaerolineae bacterium]|nr:flagellar hook-length control protein FliK [Anaerolineae bacterium]
MNVPEILIHARAAPSPPKNEAVSSGEERSFQESLETKVQESGHNSQNKAVERHRDDAQAEQASHKQAEEKKTEPVVVASVMLTSSQMNFMPKLAQSEKQLTGTAGRGAQPVLQTGQIVSQKPISVANNTQVQAGVSVAEKGVGFAKAAHPKTKQVVQAVDAATSRPTGVSKVAASDGVTETKATEALKAADVAQEVKVQLVQEKGERDVPEAKLVLIDAQSQTYAIAQAAAAKIEIPENARPMYVIQQISDGVQEMAKTGQQTIRLQIYPQELGRVEIKLVSNADGLQVVLSADRASTNRLLEHNLEQLQRSLLEAGVKVGNMSVGNQNAQENAAWQYKPQHHFAAHQPMLANEPGETGTQLNAMGMLSALDARA